jgi:hypothetical protein
MQNEEIIALTCSELELNVNSPSPLIDKPIIYLRLAVVALFFIE